MRASGLLAVVAMVLAGCVGAEDAAQPEEVQLLEVPSRSPSPPPAPSSRDGIGVSRPDVAGRGSIGGSAGAFSGGVSGSSAAAEAALQQPSASNPNAQSATPAGSQPGAQAANAMIIRVGQAVLEVDSLEPAVQAVQALALRVGGYVANIAMQTGKEQLRQATLTLKIPAPRFDEALEGIRPIGTLEHLNVGAEDVGEEFADLTARMNNAQRLEERLLTLLATRTGRLEDILAAERELARVRGEIERYEGRLRYLRARVSMSTLDVTIHEPAPILGRTSRNPIVEAFRTAWRNFVGFVAGLIAISGILIPIALILLLVVLAVRRWGRDWRRSAWPDRPPPGPETPAGR